MQPAKTALLVAVIVLQIALARDGMPRCLAHDADHAGEVEADNRSEVERAQRHLAAYARESRRISRAILSAERKGGDEVCVRNGAATAVSALGQWAMTWATPLAGKAGRALASVI